MHERIALITGAGRGLGEALATFLAGRRWGLVLTARRERELAAVVSRLGGRVLAVAGDVADPAHRHRLLDAARELGGLDLLVNNASDIGPSPMPSLADYPPEALERVLRVNVVAPVALAAATLPLLRERRGMIVNVTSDAALGAYEGWGGYGASKAALELASRTMAAELRADGVSVVSVDPGDMRTEMHQAATPDEDISGLPDPSVTIPFWAWLVEQDADAVSGARFEAQGERWDAAVRTVPA